MKKEGKNNNNDHYIGALLENMDSKIDALVDGHKFLVEGQEKMGRKVEELSEGQERLERKVGELSKGQERLERKAEIIDRKLGEKVDSGEFVILEKRIDVLEKAIVK